jgi:hypothetical protein
MQRRTLLTLLGGSVSVGLAGCIGGDDDNGDGGDNGSDDGSDILAGNENFRGESVQGGWVWFGQSDEEEARTKGIGLAPTDDNPEPVVVDAELNDDGTWQSTNIDFPPIELGSVDVDIGVTVPGGLSGEINQEEQLLTVEGEVNATIEVGGEEKSLTFPLNATTEQSGDLEGSFEVQDNSFDVEIVDNESVVNDEFGVAAVDAALNLPGEFSGDNWFVLPLLVEPA